MAHAGAKVNASTDTAKAAPKPVKAAPMPKATEKARPSETPVFLQRKCACGGACGSVRDEDKLLQRKGVGRAPASLPNSVSQTLAGSGTPMDAGTRSFMESRFGRDFGGVRLHTGPIASDSAKAVNARAYTVGQHIAFDDGEYRPHTPQGRLLLAHELAHTIQQLGFAGNIAGLSIDGGAHDPMEQEADRAAMVAMSGGKPRVRPGVGGNQLSRAEREWSADALPAKLKKAGVLRVTDPFKDKDGNSVQAFDVGTLNLPGEKGSDPSILDRWTERADNDALESTITGGEPDKLLLKQERPDSETLRGIWITKLGTTEPALIGKWNNLVSKRYGKKGSLKDQFKPIVPDEDTCHMDHIVELQLGGNNTTENLQVLDAKENTKSGRTLYDGLKAKAQAIKGAIGTDALDKVIVHYSKVKRDAYKFPEKSCYSIAKEIEAHPPAADSDEVSDWDAFPITAGSSTTLKLPPGAKDGTYKDPVPLRGDDAKPVNQAASTLVPGMLLTAFNPKKGGHTIDGTFDNEKDSKSRIPFETDKDAKLTFKVGKDGTLTLSKPSKTVKFHYPYLSEGSIKTIELKPDGVAGTATLIPSVKLIKQLDLKFAPNELAVTTSIDPKRVDPGIPGMRVKKVDLAVDLYPEFKPTGGVDFELGPANKPFADGFIKAQAGANGFEAQGQINAHVPGLDQAQGDVFYKKTPDGAAYAWSGFVELKTSTIPRTKNVSIRAEFDAKGWNVSGNLTIAIPGKNEENEAKLDVHKKGDNWLFTGEATWKPPVDALDPVKLHLTYDIGNDKLSGWGETGITYKTFHGTIQINYDDGQIWGDGRIDFKKDKATGTLNIKMSRNHKISGDGTLTYDVTPKLTVTGKVKIDENQDVLVEGLLEYKEPISLFPQIKGDKNLLTFEQNIPVPGLSIGPDVGLELKLTAALDAGFTINPAELRNIKVGGKIRPFDPNPDPSIFAQATFVSSAEAHITGTLGAGVALSILVAEISGNLGVSATAQLNANVNAPVTLKYEQQKFSADLEFEAKLALAIILALKAWVIAKAGWGPFSVSTRWDWTLAAYTYKPAFAQAKLSLKKPLHYDSDAGFTLPSWNDFDFKGPELDPSDIVGSLFHNADEKKKED